MIISEVKTNKSLDRLNHVNGTYGSWIYSIVEIGTCKYQFKGEEIIARKLLMTFSYMLDGQQYFLRKEYTISLHEKSNLRKDIQTIRGKKFTEEELSKFDIDILVGKPLMITIEMETAINGNEYPKIISLSPIPKGMPNEPLVLKGFLFSWDQKDILEMNALLSAEDNRIPSYIKDKMFITPEYKKFKSNPVDPDFGEF